jgi:hypothetical protein
VRPDTGEIVACAAGMRSIGLRSGATPPADARLDHREAPELGAGWWWVNPFDAEVSLSDTDAELRRWFRAAVGD